MTGADVLRQVREALRELRRVSEDYGMNTDQSKALAALDGCVVLTAEEAGELAYALSWFHAEGAEWPPGTAAGDAVVKLLALLTPEER